MSFAKKLNIALLLGCIGALLSPTISMADDNECVIFDEFTDNQNGTLTDPRSGLVWQRCAIGQTWSGSSCSSSPNRYSSWFDVMKEAMNSQFLNEKDWRLPTKSEFESIMTRCNGTPVVAKWIPHGSYWSISPYGDEAYTPVEKNGGEAVIAKLNDGYMGSSQRHLGKYAFAILVRQGNLSKEEASMVNREFDRAKRGLNEFKMQEVQYAARQECMYSNLPKLNEQAAYIVMQLKALQHAQDEIKRQKEASKYSGFVDKRMMYEMGQRIISIKESLPIAFEEYKKLGGSAKSIEQVRALPGNPCDSLH